ncbi:hypothetical protein, conserved [Cyanidioschyzon merolae strain 10D]|uniref:Uncharacterized protein n=1 Tax=Cyanidioschyzon merolae (strain NIES-3377 / 10D) TaxID=280699 RepID=M1UR34_CYAM1|nr:hypothetical protein, conserved [Cyanidioschyzon merolae strain 10D]BAM80041.1 hypothetical protein, conserved [Cyanidioschyzon merolae strain 10D]|eukprot:XP_005536327.1 hypothetical protein, conserved [Cyanidioschyzon merolae strain 10D]
MESWRRSCKSWRERFSDDLVYEINIHTDEYFGKLKIFLQQAPSGSYVKKKFRSCEASGGATVVKNLSCGAPVTSGTLASHGPHPSDFRIVGYALNEKRLCRDITPPEEPNRLCDSAATGWTAWDASLVLAKWLERRPYLVCNKLCLELGAGIGLVSSVAYCLGAKLTVSTDRDDVIFLLKSNLNRTVEAYIAYNNQLRVKRAVDSKLAAEVLHWESKEHLERVLAVYGAPEVILCSDLVYEELASRALVHVLVRISRASLQMGRKPLIIMAQDEHVPEVLEQFLAGISAFFTVDRVPCLDFNPNFSSELIRVYLFRPKAEHFLYNQ